MQDAKPLQPGDKCPACGGEFKPAAVPTAAQRAAAADRENPVFLPPHYDSATEAQRAQLGALHRCTECGYVTRFPVAAGAPA